MKPEEKNKFLDIISDIEQNYCDAGMGCGLEDLNIIDRYEAMKYGFEQAINQIAEAVKNA
jgi:hypothetical protein